MPPRRMSRDAGLDGFRVRRLLGAAPRTAPSLSPGPKVGAVVVRGLTADSNSPTDVPFLWASQRIVDCSDTEGARAMNADRVIKSNAVNIGPHGIRPVVRAGNLLRSPGRSSTLDVRWRCHLAVRGYGQGPHGLGFRPLGLARWEPGAAAARPRADRGAAEGARRAAVAALQFLRTGPVGDYVATVTLGEPVCGLSRLSAGRATQFGERTDFTKTGARA